MALPDLWPVIADRANVTTNAFPHSTHLFVAIQNPSCSSFSPNNSLAHDVGLMCFLSLNLCSRFTSLP